jgi:hypothetical protein
MIAPRVEAIRQQKQPDPEAKRQGEQNDPKKTWALRPLLQLHPPAKDFDSTVAVQKRRQKDVEKKYGSSLKGVKRSGTAVRSFAKSEETSLV